MTRLAATQTVINQATEIIGPIADQKLVKRGVLRTREHVRRSSKEFVASGYYGETTKQHRQAAARVAALLDRLRYALCDQNLARRYDTLVEFEIEHWRQRYAEAAITQPGMDRRWRTVDRARYEAARGAARLLRVHQLPLTLTLRGQFVRLTVLLCGQEADADLRGICRLVRTGIIRGEITA